MSKKMLWASLVLVVASAFLGLFLSGIFSDSVSSSVISVAIVGTFVIGVVIWTPVFYFIRQFNRMKRNKSLK